MNNILRIGDTTDHGGVVIGYIGNNNLNGEPMAGKGTLCALCKGEFPPSSRAIIPTASAELLSRSMARKPRAAPA